MKYYVALDVGGTSIKYGVLDEEGRFVSRSAMDTQSHLGWPSILEKVCGIVEGCLAERPLAGICVSSTGMINAVTGELFYSVPAIPDYRGINYKTILEKRFGLPCEVENDVNCAGLAEAVSGSAVGSRVALCLTVGTGIGGCVLLDGQVFHGSGDSAGEVGYLRMGGSDYQSLGAASVLTRKVSEQKADGTFWDGRRIFEAARRGDGICQKAVAEMTETLAEGIANISCVLDPDTVVLGGGIMSQQDYLRPLLEKNLDRIMHPVLRSHASLVFARYGNDAGMMGAFYHYVNMQKMRQ